MHLGLRRREMLLAPAAWAMRPRRAAAAPRLTLVALGDSLTAGYLLPEADAFPAVLERALRADGADVRVINAGVSGDTATSGLDRLDWSVPDEAKAAIVELGANDALRGVDPRVTEAALDAIVKRLRARGVAVLLAGMASPRNNGADYVKAFDGIYPKIAARHSVPLYPFFLDGVIDRPDLKLADQLHPNPAGVRVIVERILPSVRALITPLLGA